MSKTWKKLKKNLDGMYKLKITPQAKLQLKTITKKHYQLAISNALDEIKDNPFAGKLLTRELTGRFSFKIGIYRIIYLVNKKDKVVNILYAGHRSKIYD